MSYYVYIMSSGKRGTLYIGVTNDLIRRVYEHKNDLVEGFTKRYRAHNLVHFEEYNDSITAIQREKNLKHWIRDWKITLIEKENPEWVDLYNEFFMDPRVKPEDDKLGMDDKVGLQ